MRVEQQQMYLNAAPFTEFKPDVVSDLYRIPNKIPVLPERFVMSDEKTVQIADGQPAQKLMAGGKTASTPTHDFHLIPSIALQRLAERFSLGQIRKGDKAWNALSSNQDALLDKDWVLERISHVISHALKLRDKIGRSDMAGLREDDDAAAMAWGGCFLICAVDAILKDAEE